MAKKNRGLQSPDMEFRNKRVFWPQGEKNSRAYLRYLDQFMQLALNRFKWLNLPEGIDERYLEWVLLRHGQAVMFKIPGVEDRAYATRVMTTSPLNVYDNPTKFRSIGNNGWNVDLNTNHGVVVWNSLSRISIWPTLEYYAYRMAEIDMTGSINLKNQKTPFSFTGNEEEAKKMLNVYRQMDGNEPAIFGIKDPSTGSFVDVKVLNHNVPYIGIQLQQTKRDYMNEVLEYLGIDSSNTQKRERLIEAEIEANSESTMMMRLDGLNARRAAAEEFNKKFCTNIQVVWRRDYQSDNYNLTHSLEDATNAGLIGGGTDG